MKQSIPKAVSVLVAFIAKMVRGLSLFEVAIGVKQNTETAVLADLDATEKAQNEATAAQTARKNATATRDAADQKLRSFLTVAREMLKPTLGMRFSVAWKEAGFVNSLALADSMNGRVGQVSALKLYLTAHPELEAPGVLTALIATDVHTAAVTAMSDLSIAQTTARQKTAECNAAAAKLLKRARGLFQELKLLLPANDPRWLEFGFNIPGDLSVPTAPEGLVVTPGLPGNLSASWETPVHTDRFRVYRKVVGQDQEFAAVDSVTDATCDLKGLTSGTHVQVYVTAVNSAGESVPSEIVEVVVP